MLNSNNDEIAVQFKKYDGIKSKSNFFHCFFILIQGTLVNPKYIKGHTCYCTDSTCMWLYTCQQIIISCEMKFMIT